MSACSPQRFLPNNLNLFRDAVLTPSSVLPVENKVLALPTARSGTAQVALTGTYTGTEQADYDIEIVDTDVEIPRVSTPTSAGAGSGTLSGITASGAQQVYTLECSASGIQAKAAGVAIEGTTISAAVIGSGGNAIFLTVDQSGLIFTDSNSSLLSDMSAGQGGPSSPFIGPGFDWGSAVLDSATGLIPADAPRVAFGDDQSSVYLAYKQFANNRWEYHTVPALARDVPRGTLVKIVTGGRLATATNGADTETFTNIKTAYDLLYQIRTASTLLIVDGVVTNDRGPTGMAARELSLRTDAHAEVSSGTGSSYARGGFVNVSVAATAGTQLVTAECYGTNSNDSPNARLGHELWKLKSSLLGDLGSIATGEPYSEPAGNFGLTIPVKLPPGFGQDHGSIGAQVQYASRTGTETEPPICIVGLALGSDASDTTITFKYTARPTGDCACVGMPAPDLNNSCLGTPSEGGGSMAYQSDTIARLVLLHDWFADLVRTVTSYGNNTGTSSLEAPFIAAPFNAFLASVEQPVFNNPFVLRLSSGLQWAQATESMRTIVTNFESNLAQIDPLARSSPPGLREAGCTAWDTAFAELQADVLGAAGSPPLPNFFNVPSDRYDARLNWVLISAGIPTVGGADASTVAGDGCWRDFEDSAWWQDVDGVYAPFFSNHAYWSAKKAANGAYYSTHEFAFMPNIKCPESLKFGDEVIIRSVNASWGATYQSGDIVTLPIEAAKPLYLAGGVTGAPIQTWNPVGTVDGPLAPYSFNPDAPVAYTSANVGFTLAQGGIPFAKGDRFRFAIEGGHIRWRKNGGAWDGSSPPIPIPLASVAIDAGLLASFTAGAAASFVTGDMFRFRALQPWAISNTQSPSSAVWKWSGSTATYAADFGSSKTLGLVALLHDLPLGATATLWGGATSGATDWSEALTYRPGVIWAAIERTARYVRLVITNATAGSLQWPWIGVPLTTSLSSEVQLRRGYQMNRPGGNLQGGRFVGKTVSGDVLWTEAALTEADVDGLAAMLDHVKENNDEPIMFIPQVTRTTEPVLFARINSDEVDFPDTSGYNKNAAFERRVSANIPLAGVWQ
jgi:hypothetical protein